MSGTAKVCAALALVLLLQGCKAMMATVSPVYGQWVLREVQSAGATLKIDDPAVTFTFNITEDQRANGHVACNSWHGQTRIDKDRLQLLAAGVTRKRCVFDNDALLNIERSYLTTLQQNNLFSASENHLELRLANGDLWRFERHPR